MSGPHDETDLQRALEASAETDLSAGALVIVDTAMREGIDLTERLSIK